MPLRPPYVLRALGFGLVALLLAALALLVSAYASFMVVWMHVPLLKVAVTAGLLAFVFLLGSVFSCRATWRVLRKSA